MSLEQYAFTFKLNGDSNKDCKPSDYEKIIESLKKKNFKVTLTKYEPDSNGRCHVHGICEVPPKYYFKQITLSVPNLHTHFEQIKDKQGWINYCNKNQKSKRMFKIIRYKVDSHTVPDIERNGLEEFTESEACSTPELSEDESTPDGTEEVLKHIKRNLFAIKV